MHQVKRVHWGGRHPAPLKVGAAVPVCVGVEYPMHAAELKAMLDRKPFQPLRLHMTTGETVEITRPDAAIVSRSMVYVGFGRLPDGVVERMNWHNLLHIVKVEPIEDAESGSGRRKSA